MNFKNLAQAKKSINIGDVVTIKKPLDSLEEARKVTKKNTTSISTFSPNTRTWKGDIGCDIQLIWQKAKNTRIIGNKIQFIANNEDNDQWQIDRLKEMNIDYWLEITIH